MKKFSLIILVACSCFCFSQGSKQFIDSLKLELRAAKTDSARIRLLIKMGEGAYQGASLEEHLGFFDRAIHLADSIGAKRAKAVALYEKSETFSKLSVAKSYDGIKYGYEALHIFEELGDKKNQARSLQLIGWFYYQAQKYQEGIENSLKAIAIAEKLEEPALQAACHNNLGALYSATGEMAKSLEHHFKAAGLYKKIKKKTNLAKIYGNISEAYLDLKDPVHAGEYRQKAIDLFRELNSRGGVVWHYAGMAKVYLLQKKFKEAAALLDTVEVFSKSRHWQELMLNCYAVQEENYKAQGKFEMAYDRLSKYHRLNDSLNSINDVGKIAELKLQYEQQKADKIRELEEKMKEEKHRSEIQGQRIILIGVMLILAMGAVFVFFIYRSLKTVRRQKAEIEMKNKEVEMKQKEILDSITYAKRIQLAQIPTERRMFQILKRIRDHNGN